MSNTGGLSAASSTSQLPANSNQNQNQNPNSPMPRRHSAVPSLIVPSPLRSPAPPSPALPPGLSPNHNNEDDANPTETPQEKETEKKKKRQSGLFRSKSSQEDRSKRKSLISAPIPVDMPLPRRANTFTLESQMDESIALRRVESWNSPGNRKSVNYDLTSYEAQRLLSMAEPPMPYQSLPTSSDVSDIIISQNTWKSSHPHDPSAAPIQRVDSSASLYIPTRRRTITRTPGLATREADELGISKRSSLRYSHPPSPVDGRSRRGSVSPDADLAAPPPPPETLIIPVEDDTAERLQTPRETDYRQLGAMEFGSLRITNGAASPVPSLDVDFRGQGNQGQLVNYFQTRNGSMEIVGGQMETNTAVVGPKLAEILNVALLHEAKAALPLNETSWRRTPPLEPENGAPPKLTRTDSGIVATPVVELSPRMLSKADSGYSSIVSLRSLRSKSLKSAKSARSAKSDKDRQVLEQTKVESAELRPPTAGDGSSRSSSERKSTEDIAPEASPFVPSPLRSPNTDMLPDNIPMNSALSPKDVKQQETTKINKLRRRSTILPNSTPEASESVSQVPSEPGRRSPDKLRPSLSVGKKSRFQWLRGISKQATPPLPSENDKQSQDTTIDADQAMQEQDQHLSMTTSRLARQNQRSRDTLQTILSVGSAEMLQTDSHQAKAAPAPTPALPQDELPPRGTPNVLRRRSFQSAPEAQPASPIVSRPSIRRKTMSLARSASSKRRNKVGDENEMIRNDFEANVTSLDSIRDSVGRSAFDQAFATMPDRSEEDLPATRRSMTMTTQMEREVGLRRQPSGARSPGRSYTSSRSSPIPEVPGMPLQNASKARTPPPVSLRVRGSKKFRNLPPMRSPSTSGEHRRSSSRPSSRDSSHGKPDESVPPVPALPSPKLFPEFQHLNTVTEPDYDAWQPNQQSRRHSVGQNPGGGGSPGLPRSASATQIAMKSPPRMSLRHRASYDNFVGPNQRHPGPPQPRYHPGSPNPNQNDMYYQAHLSHPERNAVGKQSLEQQLRPGPAKPARHPAPANQGGPYRVLHSYNSPAYRHAPVWN